MGKNPDRVYKPRFSLYKKVQAYTQHPCYEPKPLSWFMCYYNETRERMEYTLNYLVFKRFLMRLPSGRYGVDKDYRKRFTGRVVEIKGACFVKPDDFFGFIEVEPKYTFGARHNDRVRVALNGYDESGAFELRGVIEEIIAPLSDLFCGRVEQDAEGLFVVPDDKELGDKIYFAEGESSLPAGNFVYAEIVNGEALRKKAFEMASPCQQLKTVSARALKENWRDSMPYTPQERVCRALKQVCASRSERFLIEKRFSDYLPADAEETLEKAPRRTNYIRKDFTHHAVCLIREDLAFHTEKAGDKTRVFVHVPDLTDDILPLEPLEKALCYKGEMPKLVPEAIRNRTRFIKGEKARAITVSFVTDRLGILTDVAFFRSRIVCTTDKETKEQQLLLKHLQKDVHAVHPLQTAAEIALCKLFGDTDCAFPYDNSACSALFKYFEDFLKKADRFEEKNEILSCLEPYLTDRVLMPKKAGANARIPFGCPFDSFASVLTQWSVHHYLYPHRNKENEEEFKEIIRSRTAICMWQRMFFEEYKTLKRTEDWKKTHFTDDETLHEGIFLGRDQRTPDAKHNSFVYCDKNLIFCADVPETAVSGDSILFTAKAVHGKDVVLGTCRGLKKDF